MNAIATQNATTETARWRQLITGFGLLLFFGGFLFVMDAAWENYQLYVHRTWPTFEAHIVKCNVSGSAYYSSFRHSPSESSFVRCEFSYVVDGSSRQNTTSIGDTVFAPVGKRSFMTSGLTVDKMREWIARHPPASIQTIHYNPANPNEIAFPEAEEELSLIPQAQKLWFGLTTAFFGLLMATLGRRNR